MAARRHVVITGTGRTGTTFLVELLTALGMDTGFSSEALRRGKDAVARAGLERDIREEACPYVVKSPWFCDHAEQVLARDDIALDHVLVPIRDLHAAAESRRHVVRTSVSKLPWHKRLRHAVRPRKFVGGLWHTSSSTLGGQEDILLRQIYRLMLAVANADMPVTFIRYPRLVKDGNYLYGKLRPILPGVSREAFAAAFERTARPDLVNRFGAGDA